MKKNNTINNNFLILSILGCFFLISSFILMSLTSSISSLRFVSEDIYEILDKSPVEKLDKRIFYQSNKIIVFDLSNSNIDQVTNIIENTNLLNRFSSIDLTFSHQLMKNNFFRMTKSFDEKDISKENIKKLLMTQSEATVSKGSVCYLNSCVKKFIALRDTSKKSKNLKEI